MQSTSLFDIALEDKFVEINNNKIVDPTKNKSTTTQQQHVQQQVSRR